MFCGALVSAGNVVGVGVGSVAVLSAGLVALPGTVVCVGDVAASVTWLLGVATDVPSGTGVPPEVTVAFGVALASGVMLGSIVAVTTGSVPSSDVGSVSLVGDRATVGVK